MSEILLPLCISSLNLLHLCLVSHLGKVIVSYFRLSIEVVKISLSATWCLGRENLCSIGISYFSFRISAFFFWFMGAYETIPHRSKLHFSVHHSRTQKYIQEGNRLICFVCSIHSLIVQPDQNYLCKLLWNIA